MPAPISPHSWRNQRWCRTRNNRPTPITKTPRPRITIVIRHSNISINLTTRKTRRLLNPQPQAIIQITSEAPFSNRLTVPVPTLASLGWHLQHYETSSPDSHVSMLGHPPFCTPLGFFSHDARRTLIPPLLPCHSSCPSPPGLIPPTFSALSCSISSSLSW